MFETKLDTMVREKVERIVNAMPDASGGRDRQRRQIRAHWGAEGIQAGHYERKLTAKAGRLALKVPKLKGG